MRTSEKRTLRLSKTLPSNYPTLLSNVACGGDTAEPLPTYTPYPTYTPAPIPLPTYTPLTPQVIIKEVVVTATATPMPTATSVPSFLPMTLEWEVVTVDTPDEDARLY